MSALIASLVAAILLPILGGVMAYQTGLAVPEFAISSANGAQDLAVLSPARTQILWGEISFWLGTVLGIAALVLGIMAAVKRRGRGQGITAIVLSVLGPGLFFGAVFVCFVAGAAVSTASSF